MPLRLKAFFAATCLALLGACADAPPVTSETALANLGRFSLGHNIVVTTDMQQAPFSRKASEAEIEKALTTEIANRLGRYQGEGLFHIGVKVEAYALASPGVPLVFTPKSVLVLAVNVWDDSKARKLADKPKLLVVSESLSGETLVGSGLTRSREEQLAILTRNAALKIERYLQENGQWFGVDPLAPQTTDAEEAQAALEVLVPAKAPSTSN